MCQLTPLWMRPRVAEHFAQGSDMLVIELKQSTTFSELYNKQITVVSMISPARALSCMSTRAAVCAAHCSAGNFSEGARRPLPAPVGRGRLPPRHLQLVRAAAGIQVGAHA